MNKFFLITAAATLAACTAQSATSADQMPDAPKATQAQAGEQTAVFAGGCFWCSEKDFESVPGVREAVSGYTGGSVANPTYRQVGSNKTGHYEAVKVFYDPSKVTYRQLVDHFWKTVDPTDPTGQFCDKGPSYRTAIFATVDQRSDAEQSKANIEATKPFSDNIVTPIIDAQPFYDAEDYHQNYYKVNPKKYKRYRGGCGRDRRLQQLWG